MITTIIFDLGNVLVRINNARTLPHIAKYLKNNYDESLLEKMLYYNPREPDNGTLKFFQKIHRQYHTGSMSTLIFYNTLKKQLGFSEDFTYEQFCKIWPARFERIEPTIDVLKRLKKYRKYLLSDTNELDIHYLKTHHGDIFEQFDQVFYSHLTGIDKKSDLVWKNIIQESKENPDTHLYIDDLGEYVTSSERLGMKGIIYTGTEKLINDLLKLDCVLDKVN